jgi:hypothetical protein
VQGGAADDELTGEGLQGMVRATRSGLDVFGSHPFAKERAKGWGTPSVTSLGPGHSLHR